VSISDLLTEILHNILQEIITSHIGNLVDLNLPDIDWNRLSETSHCYPIFNHFLNLIGYGGLTQLITLVQIAFM